MSLVYRYYAYINTASFIAIGFDKMFAKAQTRRISEKVLFTFPLLGGAPGGLIAMIVFNHKIKKMSFMLPYIGFTLAHFAVRFYAS